MSSTSMRDVRAKPEAGFQFYAQKLPVPESVGVSWAKKPHLDTKPDNHQDGRKSAGSVSTSTTDSSKNIIFICCAGWYTSKLLAQ